MICTQPPLDVCKIMKNRCCCCLHCGLSGGGGEGRPHVLLAIARLDGNDNRNGNCLSKKRGWTREKERGNLKMGLFFLAVLFCYCFWLFFNVGQLISYQDQVNYWTSFSCKISLSFIQIWWSIYYSSSSSWLFIGYLLQDFSSSRPNLVITFLFGN
jgi:hypothetical protein